MVIGLRRHFSKVVKYSYCTITKMSTGEGVGVPLNKILSTLENFAPKLLAESWDNTGLLVEPYTPRNISKILLTNDLTEDVALEASNNGCQMIISYHPPIFAPLKSVVQRVRVLVKLMTDETGQFMSQRWAQWRFPFVILSPELHRNCYGQACRLPSGALLVRPITSYLKKSVQPAEPPSAWKERIVSFLLENRISLYSPHTSWDCIQGGVNDWLGSNFAVATSKPIQPGIDPNVGAGRFLKLQSSISLLEAITKVKELTRLQHVRFAIGKGKALSDDVKTVALCAGSGSSVLKGVVADLYLTGEMLHHDVLDATQKGISVILTNHSDSERGYLRVFKTHLQARLENQVQVIVSENDKDPLTTV